VTRRARTSGAAPALVAEESEAFSEPELPRAGRGARRSELRTGWTTGSCAAAAAKAATLCLVTGQRVKEVEIGLPSGQRAGFAVLRCDLANAGESAEAVVVKDAGDDPDVTNGAHIVAIVTRYDQPEILITGGPGVGTVTLPGLGLPVGQAAINPVPREMITQAVKEALRATEGGAGPASGTPVPGVRVVISVPGGERLARRTINARLGVLGGISILGTTGIVRPFSTESWRASVEQAVRVAAASDCGVLVLSTGGRTERAAMALRPDLPPQAFVEAGDFPGAAIRATVGTPIREILFVGMVGKLAKLAAGVLMTHATGSQVDPELLAEVTSQAGGSADLVAAVARANTARHAYELWEGQGLLTECATALCERVAGVLRSFAVTVGVVGDVHVGVVMVDFAGASVVASAGGPALGAGSRADPGREVRP
jgi:cobalt-precorrin-5B (C1)-methyltransferase